MHLLLIRNTPNSNAVHGTLSISSPSPSGEGARGERLSIPTLENTDYIIPAGTYPITVTHSPRFNRLLPILGNVPKSNPPSLQGGAGGRLGIRIHRGTLPEHSKGCILVSAEDEKRLTNLLLQDRSEHRIEITQT